MLSASATGCNLLKLLAFVVLVTVGSQEPNTVIIGEDASQERVVSGRVNALPLNAHTFGGNVLRKGKDEVVEHWIVNFCPNWWDPCQNLALPFDQFGVEWERKLNTELLTQKVRFATVDCATDKVLCNQQHVVQYPTVHHYNRGKIVSTWMGGRASDAEKLRRFLDKRLGKTAEVLPPPEVMAIDRPSLAARLVPGDRAIDFALVLLVLSLNAWAVFNNPQLWQKSAAGAFEEPAAAPKQAAAVSAPEAADDGASARAAGVARFLPEDWRGASQSMEL